jgi:hypothetical protein
MGNLILVLAGLVFLAAIYPLRLVVGLWRRRRAAATIWRTYGEAAKQGDPDAQYHLGNFSNASGDDAMASYMFEKAAEQGHTKAQFSLGHKYEFGNGVMMNTVKALHWYRRAAELGNDRAQKRLGDWYKNGRNVPIDNSEAFHWYRKAAEQGNVDAVNVLSVWRVFFVQYFLNTLGYYSGKLTSQESDELREAILAFQHDRGLLDDAEITDALLHQLCA